MLGYPFGSYPAFIEDHILGFTRSNKQPKIWVI